MLSHAVSICHSLWTTCCVYLSQPLSVCLAQPVFICRSLCLSRSAQADRHTGCLVIPHASSPADRQDKRELLNCCTGRTHLRTHQTTAAGQRVGKIAAVLVSGCGSCCEDARLKVRCRHSCTSRRCFRLRCLHSVVQQCCTTWLALLSASANR